MPNLSFGLTNYVFFGNSTYTEIEAQTRIEASIYKPNFTNIWGIFRLVIKPQIMFGDGSVLKDPEMLRKMVTWINFLAVLLVDFTFSMYYLCHVLFINHTLGNYLHVPFKRAPGCGMLYSDHGHY